MQKKLHVFIGLAGISKYSLAWWKRHFKVYNLIARSQCGLMVQILASLITHLLVAINCRNNYNKKVSIKRFRELILNIKNKAGSHDFDSLTQRDFKEQRKNHTKQKPNRTLLRKKVFFLVSLANIHKH